MVIKLTKVEIMFDGVNWTNVTSFCRKWEYKGTLDNIADLVNIRFLKTIKDSYTLLEWLPIRIYEGWTTSTDRLIFKGVLSRIKDDYSHINCEAADETYKLLKAKNVAVYNSTDAFGGSISAIATDIIESIGLNATVETTTTVIDQFIVNDNTDLLERVTALAKIEDYNILYDPEVDIVYFVSKGYFANTNVLTLPDDIAYQRPKWDEDATRLFNDLTVKGGTTSGVKTQLFDGDGAELEFTVDLTPSDSVKVEENIGGTWTEQVQGTIGVSTTFDYSIDKANKKIVYVAGNAPAVGVGNVRVTISAQIPPVVNVVNETSISKYHTGTDELGDYIGIKEVLILDDITSVDDAFSRANKLLATFSEPFFFTTITLKASVDKLRNYKLGEVVSVTDANMGFTERDFIITEIEREYPGGGAKLTLGDKAYRIAQFEATTDARLRRLENLLSGDYDVLNAYRNFTHSIVVAISSATYQEECINDSFIVGHDINGIVGYGTLLDDFESGWATNWTVSGLGLISKGNDTTNYMVGLQSGKLTFNQATGTDEWIYTTQSFGDLSTYTGVSSGTPSQGTIGLWLRNGIVVVTNVKLRIGSSDTNYAEYTGVIYQSSSGFTWQGTTTFTYLTFDLNIPDSVTGTPDWTAVDYVWFGFTYSNGNTNFIDLDYFTISQSNYIGENGIGYRPTYKTAVTIV